MTMTTLALLAALLGADANDDARAKLQGTWVVESFVVQGQRIDEMAGSKIEFNGDKMIHTVGNKSSVGKFVLDVQKAPPRIDIITKGPTGGDSTSLGIFEVAEDALRIAGGVNSVEVGPQGQVLEKLAARPAKFDPQDCLLIVLKREEQ
jgi:uncharacterized protein (TIGR03067 family)